MPVYNLSLSILYHICIYKSVLFYSIRPRYKGVFCDGVRRLFMGALSRD